MVLLGIDGRSGRSSGDAIGHNWTSKWSAVVHTGAESPMAQATSCILTEYREMIRWLYEYHGRSAARREGAPTARVQEASNSETLGSSVLWKAYPKGP
jgi:hypothetical protein